MPDRLRIGVDLDGVVYRFSDTANYLIKEHFGIDIPEWTDWDFAPDFLEGYGRPEVWTWLWKSGIDLGLFRYGSIYKGSREALVKLARMGDLVVITARPKSAVNDTLEWLAYQRFPTSEVHILSGAPKSTVKCDVYIDDSLDNMDELAQNAPAYSRLLLVDRPWNNQPQGYAVRCYDWQDVLRSVRAKYASHHGAPVTRVTSSPSGRS